MLWPPLNFFAAAKSSSTHRKLIPEQRIPRENLYKLLNVVSYIIFAITGYRQIREFRIID
jgi:hypothetical protein